MESSSKSVRISLDPLSTQATADKKKQTPDEDFLDTWTDIDKCRLFDADWKMSSQWIKLTLSASRPWSHGDVSC